MADFTALTESVPDSVVDGSSELAARLAQQSQPILPDGAPQPNLVTTPPLPGQVPDALLPSVSAQPSVPVGASNASLAPSLPAAPPPVDPAQYTQPAPQPAAQPVQALNGLADIYNQQKQANNNIAKAVADKAVAEDAAYQVQQERMAQQEARMADMQAKFNAEYSSRVGHLDDLSKQLSSEEFTNAKIDGQRFWSSLSTGQKILGAIAIGLGAAGSSITGGENGALKIIQSAIDRDVEAQKFNIQNKQQNLKTQIGAEQSMLENLKAKFGSDLQAETAFRILAADQVQNKLKQLAGRTDNVVLQANARTLNAKLDQEKMMQMQALKSQMLLQQRLAQGDLSTLGPAELAQLPKEYRELIQDQQSRQLPGYVGQAPTKQIAEKFYEKVNETQPAIDGVKRILALSDPNNPKGFSKLSLEDRAKVSTELVALIGSLRVPFTGPGILTESEFNRLSQTLGDPTKLASLPSIQRTRLLTVAHKLQTDLDGAAERSGFRKRPELNVPMKPYQPR